MIGATPGPFTCFLLERGLKTFRLRMEQHNRAGLAVRGPWKPSQDRESLVSRLEIASRLPHRQAQMRGFGSVVTFSGERQRQGDSASLTR